MAGARIHKLGTILTRQEGLLKSGATKWENRPIWYDICVAFPPLEEPKFFRDPPKDFKLREIFYREDILRAKFAEKNGKSVIPVNIDSTTKDFPSLDAPKSKKPKKTDLGKQPKDKSRHMKQ